ncbi:MAG: adenylate kinase [Kiritimatiellia bacterium]
MKIVILLGAPGSGKGTIAGRLTAQSDAFRHVSSGDLLRDAVKRQTPAGCEAEACMAKGELVPDSVIADLIKDFIAEAEDNRTLILDGFPRTAAQAEILERIIDDSSAKLHAVILLEVADDILFERIAGRRTCPKCGAAYHIKTIRPEKDGICDVCGSELVVRKDDNPETVKHRLAVYREQTVPLIDYYSSRGLLTRIDGVGDIDDVAGQLREALA